MKKKIGILGGTFNPPHKGHIRIAQLSLKKFKLAGVIFVPTGLPPHKSRDELAPSADRLKMLRLALAGKKRFRISKIEIDRSGYSYAVDTFNELKKGLGNRAELYYIMGMDSINDILSWKKPLELFKLCRFIVATRPGAKIRTFKRLMKFPPLKDNVDKIHLVETNLEISSSDIRASIRAGKLPSRLLSPGVAKYIQKKGLYK